MQVTFKRVFGTIGFVIAGLLAAMLVFMLAMTQPRFGTPVANWALGIWAPDGSHVETAHLKLPALTTVSTQGVSLPEIAEARQLEARINPFGFLPLVSWVSRLETSDGYVRYDATKSNENETESGPGLAGLRKLLDEVQISNVETRITRETGEQTITIETASGSLRAGTLTVAASSGASTLEFDGGASSGMDQINGTLRVTGENFAEFAMLAGLAAPDTPPFDVRMSVDVLPDRWQFDLQPDTTMGDSDLAGTIIVSPREETPVINADLVSQSLDADDLGIVFGIPIGVGGDETVGPAQTKAREAFERSDRLIPNGVIDFSRLDAVNGRVKYVAESVRDSVLDVRRLELDFEIDGRVVRAPTLRADFAEGSLDAYLTLDGSQSPAHTTASGKLDHVPFKNLSLAPYLRGNADGTFELTTEGDGFRDAAANLDGTFSVWSTDADILALVAEGAALDIGEALTLLGEEADNRTYADARCAVIVADFDTGTGTLSPAVIDTDDSLVVVRGDINLGDETMKLSIRSDAKDASLGTLVGDVSIGGTLRKPQIQPFGATTVAQIGLAGLLGTLSGGLAALPFIEPGMAEDAPCGALLSRAQSAAQDSDG